MICGCFIPLVAIVVGVFIVLGTVYAAQLLFGMIRP